MDTIFVTGGTGFLGRHLIAALCRAGYQLRILSRHPQDHIWLKRYANLEVIRGDLRDAAAVRKALDGSRYVIHAAALFRFWGNPADFKVVNVGGTKNILAAAYDAGVERFIHISTAAVYGNPDPENIIDETYTPYPADPYQQSKYEAELCAQDFYEQYDFPVVILRPGAFYGPLGTYAFNRLFFHDPMRGIIMQIEGGRHIIFPAYIGDVADSILKALDKGRLGEIYNVCGDWISHKEAFDIVCKEANLRWPRLNLPGWIGITASRVLEVIASITHREPFWPLNLRSYVYNNWRISSEKARQELGFAPISFQEGARRTIAWYKAGRPEYIPEIEC